MQHGKMIEIDRCPHCRRSHPTMEQHFFQGSADHRGNNPREWGAYRCAGCGGFVTAATGPNSNAIADFYPAIDRIDEAIPERAREYLTQAVDSIHSPAGAVMLAASAIDSMLKAKNYRDGVLNSRIKEAARDHIITPEMAEWAHDVRLDANDQRHADDAVPLPTEDDARRVIEFAAALGEFLFVLPARVQRGRTIGPPSDPNI